MKPKHYILIIMAFILVVLLLPRSASPLQSGWLLGWLITDTSTKIEDGFTEELLSVLDTKYHITIPEDAVFIKGINSNDMHDPSVVILFELPAEPVLSSDREGVYNYIFQKLELDESRHHGGGHSTKIAADWYEEFGGELEYEIKDERQAFTYISYKLQDDKIIIRFVGWRPGATFS